ncbi:hypothetical protein [Longimicrobium sp.]|uniref:hypothetical protein n=1 Tax=Longimicrobium sp. TaxID=2029185 RepID=UPI002BB1BCE7|nr:hypothetical protein [Longimicrobium sp.]HSU14852.1 hypothetical protein [Longimicrobium sp.]
MKKLRLDVDSLGVESFATAPARAAAGTVRGAGATEICSAGPVTCHPTYDPCDTCATSCAGGPWCDCLPSGCPKASVCCPTA